MLDLLIAIELALPMLWEWIGTEIEQHLADVLVLCVHSIGQLDAQPLKQIASHDAFLVNQPAHIELLLINVVPLAESPFEQFDHI